MTTLRATWTAVLLAAMLAPGPVRADEAAPFTLADALAAARKNNEVPKIAEARLAQAKANRDLVTAALLPQIVLSATYTRRAFENVQQIQGQDVVLQAANALNAQFIADARIFEPRAIPLLKQAEAVEAAQALDAHELERRLAFDVSEAFLAVLTAEAVRDAANERFNFADMAVANAKARLAAGLGESSALTRTELEQAAARLAQANADTVIAQARAVLGTIMGADVPKKLAPLPPLADGPIAADVEAAGKTRNDLLAQVQRTEAAKASAEEPNWAWLPALTLRAFATTNNEPGFLGRYYNWNIALTLSWLMYDGGQRTALAAARAALAYEAGEQSGLLGRQIAREVRESAATLEGATKALGAARARREIALKNAGEVAARFRAGFASALDQADASVSAFEAQVEVLRAEFTVRRGELALLEALGRWPAEAGK